MQTPTKIALIAGIALLPIAAVVIYGISKGGGTADEDGKPVDGQYYEVDWNLLRELDFQTGTKPAKLAAVDGQFVKVPGFVVPLDDYLEIFRFPVVEYYKDVGFDLAKTPFEVIATDFMNSYLSRVREATLFQGVPELLVELKGEGVACSVLSAAPERDLKELLAHHGIETFFEHVYGLTDHYAHSKIDRGRELVGRLGVDAGELILVGDTDHDLEVGEALGIDVLLVPGGHQSHARLAKRHHRVGRRSPHLSF